MTLKKMRALLNALPSLSGSIRRNARGELTLDVGSERLDQWSDRHLRRKGFEPIPGVVGGYVYRPR